MPFPIQTWIPLCTHGAFGIASRTSGEGQTTNGADAFVSDDVLEVSRVWTARQRRMQAMNRIAGLVRPRGGQIAVVVPSDES